MFCSFVIPLLCFIIGSYEKQSMNEPFTDFHSDRYSPSWHISPFQLWGIYFMSEPNEDWPQLGFGNVAQSEVIGS